MPQLDREAKHKAPHSEDSGSHANGKQETANLYSRNQLTWPVNLLCYIIQEIKHGDFQPDLQERHLQLSEEVYRRAVSGGCTGDDQTLKALEK